MPPSRWCLWGRRPVGRTLVSSGRGVGFKLRGPALHGNPVGNGRASWGAQGVQSAFGLCSLRAERRRPVEGGSQGPPFPWLLGRRPQVSAHAPDLGFNSRFIPCIYANVLVSGKWCPHSQRNVCGCTRAPAVGVPWRYDSWSPGSLVGTLALFSLYSH